jgi:hypothetical protein
VSGTQAACYANHYIAGTADGRLRLLRSCFVLFLAAIAGFIHAATKAADRPILSRSTTD